MIYKILGAILVLWGIADLSSAFPGGDFWGLINVNVPDALAEYSPYIAIAIGVVFFWLGSGNKTPQRF